MTKIFSILLLVTPFIHVHAQRNDKKPPTVLSINRQSPATQTTGVNSVVFRATFSEGVTGVDATDFTFTVVSGSTTSTISGVTAVGTGGNIYDVTVSSINGSGTFRLDLKSNGTGITDLASNAISSGYTSGQTYIIDKAAPTVLSINRQSPTTQITNASSVVFRATFSEGVAGVDVTDFVTTVVSGSLTSGITGIAPVGTAGSTYDITVASITGNGVLRLDLKSTGTGITDAASNAISGGYTSGQTYTIDKTAPTLTFVGIASNNVNPSIAIVGNIITLSFTASEPINTPTVTIATHSVTPTAGSGNSFTATYTITSSDAQGTLPFTINYKDIAGNSGAQVTSTTNGSSVVFNGGGGPTVLSINRQSPTTSTTNAGSVTFRIIFSKKVTGVDRTDFIVTAVSGNVTGSLGNKAVATVGTDGTTYDVTVSSITGAGTLRLDLKSSGTGIVDANNNPISGGFTAGQTYIIDRVAPSVASINRQFPLTTTTNSTSLTYRMTFSEKVRNVDNTDFTLTRVSGTATGSILSNAVVATGADSTAYDVTVTSVSGSGILRLDLKSNNTNITDAAGNSINGGYTSGQTYTVDQAKPTLSPVSIASNNNNTSFAIVGNIATLSFTASEPVNTPVVTIATHAAAVTAGSNNSFTATYTMINTDAETIVPFTIDFTDLAGNAGAQVTATTDGTKVIFDKTVPTVTSINRQSPSSTTTNATSLTYRVTFSEKVKNVDNTDFTLTSVSGTVTGSILSNAVVATGTDSTAYDITVTSVSGSGTLRLDLNSNNTGITDAAGNSINGGYTSGQTYIEDQANPTLSPVSITSNNSNTSFANIGNVITLSFITSKPVNTPVVTIATHAATVTAGGGNGFTATYTMTNSDAEAIVPFTIDFTDLAGNAGVQVTATTDGTKVTFDKTVPTVTSINRQSPSSTTTNATSLTYRVTFSEKVKNVDNTDFTLTRVSGTATGSILSNAVVATGADSTAYDVTVTSVSGSGTLRLDLNSNNTGITDAAGNSINGGYTSGQTYIEDQANPTLSPVSIASNNNNTSFAIVGNIVTLSFTASEPVNTPVVTIATHAAAVTAGSNNSFTATYTMINTDAETIVPFTIDFTDLAGNAGAQVTATTDGTKVIFDKTVPTVTSINRQSPSSTTTNATSLTYRVTFSEKVKNVDNTDFTLTSVSGTATGSILSNAVVATGTDSTAYDVTVTSVSGSGTLRLDLNSNNTGITDAAGNSINGGYTSGQTYIEDQANPTLSPVSITSNNSNTSFANIGNVVTLSFITSKPVNTPVVTIATHAATVTAGGGNSFTATYTMTNSDAEAIVPFTIDFTDLTGNAGVQVTATTDGTEVTFDMTSPTVASIKRQSPTTDTTAATSVIFRTTFSEIVTGVDKTDFSLATAGSTTGMVSSITNVNSSTYDITVNSINGNGTLGLNLNSTSTGIADLAGNFISGGFTDGETYTENQTKPMLSPVSIASNNSNTSFARVGNVVTLSFTASKPVNTPIVTIATHTATVTAGSSNSFTATYTMANTDAEAIIPFTIDFTDLAGNTGVQVSATTDGTNVTFDKTAPVVISIKRQSPTADTTTATSVIFRTTFSEIVTGVDKNDFSLTTTGATAGVITSITNVDNSTYDITVESILGTGTLGLNLKSTSTGIADLAGNIIGGGYSSGETYSIISTASFVTSLGFIPISINTGEKPQSKVWNYNGFYWAVLANTNGTYLWRLDGTNWTSILKISDSTNVRADCKRVGDVTHILLFRGFNGPGAQLVSVQYVPATNTYELWSGRPTTVDIALDNGVETAAIDIDGRGRMWLASAAVSAINVRWSDAPYSIWGSSTTIATGVDNDDICDVIYMPTAEQIGVLWSNQNTKRFGFKTHIDGARPSAWSADEVPAAQSAINFGHGMADDHMHMALASDGTLYCAVKTSYDATGYPKLALLIRRPDATWDNLYEVSQTGTRPIPLLNESIGKLKIVYTTDESGGDIVYKETSTASISFSAPTTLLHGIYNNATSMKENYNSDIIILAGDTVRLRAAGILLTDTRSTTLPTVPVLISPVNTTSAVMIPPNLKWNPSAGAASYQVQISTSPDFATTVIDQSNILTTFLQIPGLMHSTLYYWRVRANNSLGHSDWSTVWNFSTDSGGSLMARWTMDEGSGTTLIDSSEYKNNGTTVGNPTWVPGRIGQALQLDGTSQYATVPTTESLNPTTAMTFAAWIKPQKNSTQYILKKSSVDLTDGYELSLSNSGRVFFRVNQDSLQNTYRVNSLTPYPTDGNTWMHIAATFNGSVIKIYINGVLDSSKTFTAPVQIISNKLDLAIGSGPNGNNKFQGAIDDARVYNKALSDSEIFSMVAGAPIATPTLSTPANNATNVVVNPTNLNWNVVAAASSYQVQVSTVSDFSSTVFDQSNIPTNSIAVPGLSNFSLYYWRVRATNAVGTGDWSAGWNFTTISSAILVGNWKMEEGSGTAIVDASQYGNNGTTTGNPVWVAGKIGQALQLNGTSQYAIVPNNGSINPTNAITLTAWIKPELANTTQYIIKKAISNTTDGYELSLANTGKVFFRINQKTSADAYRVNSLTSYPTDGNTWMHIAATYDGVTLKIYINGVLDAFLSPSSPPPISSNNLSLGIGAQPDGTSKLKGAIDEARVYNTALNASDILNIVAQTSPIAPVLISPANNVTNVAVNPTNLNWNVVAAAASYQVQVSTVSDFSSTVFDQSNISTNSIAVPGLSNFSLYYWRVRTTNAVGTGDWSASWNFTTISNAALVGNWKMDEGSGTAIVDASQYGNNGTTKDNPVWVTGKVGQALQLNGTSQYATVPNNGSLNPTSAITLAAWIKPEVANTTQYIIKKATNGATDGYELSLANTGKVFFRINQKTSADAYRVNSLTSYPTDGNTWMHIAATYDGIALKIYINGVLNASLSPASPPAISSNTLSLGIGAQPDGTSKLKGAIDEAQVYNVALSAAEIANLATTSSLSTQIASSITSQHVELKEKLYSYPNPIFEKGTINFVLASSGSYVLDLYDLKGSRVAVLKEGKTEAGKLNTAEINSTHLAKGLYVVRLQTNKGTKTLKIIVR